MRLLGRIILILLATIGSTTLLIACLGIFFALKERPAPLPDQMVLALDLNAGVVETMPDGPFGVLGLGNAYQLKDIVATLDKAAGDPRVVALVARLDSVPLGMARAQELRDAILAFRKSNKRTVIFSSSLGEFGAATIPYYVATAFQEIWLQPSGDIGMTGFMAESPFFKGTLDLLDIKPQFGARYEYKSAIDIFTQTKFTKESRESIQGLIEVVDAAGRRRYRASPQPDAGAGEGVD